ncbi:diguanylate cyclase domain-containing protein [Gemmobacter sp.]|uniref:diguanylate cyclase domain-containing protein n=1 Tax=Gemmobacter sp. TaxID=1898957 RepID=UPI002AFE628E|nr:diguanylate cyclase [Gemmobacter sp.]
MDDPCPPMITIGTGALGRAMPMHLCLDAAGRVTSAGPTLAKIAPAPLPGRAFFDLFDLRRPVGIADMSGLRRAGQRLHLALRAAPATGLRGLAVALADGGVLLNLSLGIDLPEAVRQHRLTDGDFAPTDLAVELLYLIEVKTLVMAELHDLNRRLQGAKSVAEEQALTDTLTGLRNRRAMDARLADLIDSGQPFGLMHLDLDWFKQVNDTLGHAAGDHVLQQVGRILTGETRLHDTVARVGGDEFVIILPGLVDAARMHGIARRIIDRLTAPIPFEGRLCAISASVGMTISSAYPRPEPDRMLSDADQALYASKHAGRGRVSLHDP